MSEECESQSALIDKIETAAGMAYDEIKYIVSKGTEYPIGSRSLEEILFDLENGFTACPF